jgi:serine/threonine-protein phosphatase 2A regulatory subunit A
MIRRAIAINLGDFSKVIGHPIDIVLKSYKSLLKDQQDAVKIEALKNSCILAQILKDNNEMQKLEDDIVLSIKSASEEKKSWRLRFSVAEILAEFTHIIGKDLADKHIKEIIERLLGDSEPEVRSEIIIKVTEIVEFVKPDLVLDKLILLSSDTSQHVRESLAECICKVATHIDPALYVEKALPGMVQLMKDAATEVRVSILNHIEIVTKAIGKENTETHIIPALLELTTDKQWRVRYGIAQFFPKFAEIFGYDLFLEKMEKISLDFLADNVFKIREQSMQNLSELKNTLGKDWFEKTCKEKVREFSRSDKCTIRIQSIFLIRLIYKAIDPDILNKDLIPVMIGLKDDSVPNIKFNIAKLLDEISDILSRENIFIGKSALEALKDSDADEDVKYFASKTLKNSTFSSS